MADNEASGHGMASGSGTRHKTGKDAATTKAGQRFGSRTPVALEIEITGAGGTYAGQTIDLPGSP